MFIRGKSGTLPIFINNFKGNGTLMYAERAGFRTKTISPWVLDQRISAFISVQKVLGFLKNIHSLSVSDGSYT
jgi:hypothetical protein